MLYSSGTSSTAALPKQNRLTGSLLYRVSFISPKNRSRQVFLSLFLSGMKSTGLAADDVQNIGKCQTEGAFGALAIELGEASRAQFEGRFLALFSSEETPRPVQAIPMSEQCYRCQFAPLS